MRVGAGNSKLDEHKADIIDRYLAGEKAFHIAIDYEVHASSITRCLRRWSEIDPRLKLDQVKEATLKGVPDPKSAIKPEAVAKLKRFVVTSALNNCDINTSFLKSIQTFCEVEHAQLLVIPVAYKNLSLFVGRDYKPEWPAALDPYYVTGDVELASNLVIMGSMRIQATAARPIQSTYGISKGRSAIFGHPRVALETVAAPMNKMPLVYMTTGTLSTASYSETKAGRLGEFHHSFGAVVVETDGEYFWWRHIHPDKFGHFIDIDKQYGPDGSVFPAPPAEAIIVGDVHVGFDNKDVVSAVMFDLVNATDAQNVILHDLLDFFSGSHHHRDNHVLRVLKSARGRNNVYSELKDVSEWLDRWCRNGTHYHIIRSNHHDHLDKWLNNNSALIDAENLWLWHHLNAVQMKEALEMAKSAEKADKWGVTSAFELAMQALCKKRTLSRFSFADDKSPLEFHNIDCSNHGDKGPNGSRGSRAGFARAQRKTFIGHSHSPGIHDGCYQVGKSASGEAYLSGYSSHLHCSGIIYADGCRTLFPIINGKIHLKGEV